MIVIFFFINSINFPDEINLKINHPHTDSFKLSDFPSILHDRTLSYWNLMSFYIAVDFPETILKNALDSPIPWI